MELYPPLGYAGTSHGDTKPIGTYKFGWPWRLFGTGIGLFFGAGSFYYLLNAERVRFIFVPGIFMGIWIVIAIFRSKLVLYPDVIEVYGAFCMRSISRDRIFSKTYAGANGIFLWRDKRWQWPFQVATQLDTDDTFWNWINGIPTGFPAMVKRWREKEAAHR